MSAQKEKEKMSAGKTIFTFVIFVISIGMAIYYDFVGKECAEERASFIVTLSMPGFRL